MLTIFGVAALTFMMSMYALEARGCGFVLAFAVGCGLSSLYGFLSGAWPFGIVEAVWVSWHSVASVHRGGGIKRPRRPTSEHDVKWKARPALSRTPTRPEGGC
jgi:hypothetical protein